MQQVDVPGTVTWDFDLPILAMMSVLFLSFFLKSIYPLSFHLQLIITVTFSHTVCLLFTRLQSLLLYIFT